MLPPYSPHRVGARVKGILSFTKESIPLLIPREKGLHCKRAARRAAQPAESGACYFSYLNDLVCFYLRCRFACDSLALRNFRLLWTCTDLLLSAEAALLRSPRVGLLLFYFNSVLFCERFAAYGNTHRTAARFGINKADKNKARTVA